MNTDNANSYRVSIDESGTVTVIPPLSEEAPYWAPIKPKYAHGIPGIRRIIFSGVCTIVLWEDGSKTLVRCAPDQIFSEYGGFAAAVCKKLFGTSTRVRKLVASAQREKEKGAGKGS